MNVYRIALLLLLLPAFAAALTTISANCSHITVTTDLGSDARVDIEYNVNGAWEPIYAMDSASSGTVVKPTLFNGTHRAAARHGTGSIVERSDPIEITTCAPPKRCTSKTDCNSGQVCAGGFCTAGECLTDTECSDDKKCNTASKTCVAVPCACGSVANHVCNAYQCCSDENCTAERKCVNHLCVSESSPGSQIDPAKTSAQAEISAAETAISQAKTQGKDMTAAEAVLAQANQKFNQGDYPSAQSLATIAKQSAGGAGTGSEGQGSSGETAAGQNLLASGAGVACIGGIALFFVFLIGLFLVVALVAGFYKRR